MAERSFLNLWSYPNLYIDKRQNGKGSGKELCDLLVVCGNSILIFSDKTVKLPTDGDLNLAWVRWYRRAINKSVQQVRGAERWIEQYPNRIYLDPECSHPLPIRLPPSQHRNVHAIIVALGAGAACRKFFEGGTGSLMIRPTLSGDAHMDPNASEFLPFSIGDVDPNGPFTHIFDDVTLDIVMDELDTITDFTRYLQKKAEFIRSGRLVVAHGEEDLLAYYMTKMNSRGEHDFIHPEGRDWRPDDRVVFDEGHYSELSVNPRYIAKRRADGDSYVWDELIKAFTTHMMAGTTIVQKGHKFVLADHEAAIRYMALQDRFRRRILGSAILDAVQKSGREQRFVRALIPGPGEKDRDTGFFFLMLAYPEDLNLSGGYEQYRELRLSMLKAYALNFLKRYSFLKRIIGIATEPPTISTGRPGSSEDLIFLEPEKWTDELHADANRFAEVFDIMRKGRFREAELGGDEFPRD